MGSININSSIASSIVLAATDTLIIDASVTDIVVSGAISGLGNVVVNGSKIVTFMHGENTYTGTTTLNSGALKAGCHNAFSPNSVVILSDKIASTLDLNGFDCAIGGLIGGETFYARTAATVKAAQTVSKGAFTQPVQAATGPLRASGLSIFVAQSTLNALGQPTSIIGTVNVGTATLSISPGLPKTTHPKDWGFYGQISTTPSIVLEGSGQSQSMFMFFNTPQNIQDMDGLLLAITPDNYNG